MPRATLNEVIRALDRTIPPEELAKLYSGETPNGLHGGNNYIAGEPPEFGNPENRVTSYNNTRNGPEDIIAWIEQAILLAGHPTEGASENDDHFDPDPIAF